MPGPCAQRRHCVGQDYCPCVVRGLLAEYAELLEQRTVLLERHHGDATRVQGKVPAHQVLEGQIARKADVALALAALWDADPEIARAVALAHGLDRIAGRVVFAGARHPTSGRLVSPSAVSIGRSLWRSWLPSRDRHNRSVADERRRDLVAEMIAQGEAWMARWLGWQPGLVEEETA